MNKIDTEHYYIHSSINETICIFKDMMVDDMSIDRTSKVITQCINSLIVFSYEKNNIILLHNWYLCKLKMMKVLSTSSP